MSRRTTATSRPRLVRMLALTVACTLLAVTLYGPLAWLAGPTLAGAVLGLSGTHRRRQARRGLRRAAQVARRAG